MTEYQIGEDLVRRAANNEATPDEVEAVIEVVVEELLLRGHDGTVALLEQWR